MLGRLAGPPYGPVARPGVAAVSFRLDISGESKLSSSLLTVGWVGAPSGTEPWASLSRPWEVEGGEGEVSPLRAVPPRDTPRTEDGGLGDEVPSPLQLHPNHSERGGGVGLPVSL